jgi:hypothetical protein
LVDERFGLFFLIIVYDLLGFGVEEEVYASCTSANNRRARGAVASLHELERARVFERHLR